MIREVDSGILTPALVVFDIDGTLLQTERVTVPAVQETFRAYGLAIPDTAVICSFFGRPTEGYDRWLMGLCPQDRAQEILDATNARELRCIGEYGELYPGARDVLTALKADGHALAVCSNGPDAYVEEFLRVHGVRDFFAVIRTRGTRYAGKSEMLAEILELLRARPLIVVGDRHDDIEAAHLYSGLAIAADYGFGDAEELREADAHVSRAADIPDAIRQLLRASS